MSVVRVKKLHDFYRRVDNTHISADKQESQLVDIHVGDGPKCVQKHIYTAYIYNLHDKFKLENPDIDICRTLFYHVRQKDLDHGLLSRLSYVFMCQPLKFCTVTS